MSRVELMKICQNDHRVILLCKQKFLLKIKLNEIFKFLYQNDHTDEYAWKETHRQSHTKCEYVLN